MPLHTMRDFLKLLRDSAGSDLHLCPGEIPHVRVNGILVPVEEHSALSPDDVEGLVAEIAGASDLARWRSETHVDFGHDEPDLGRFRVNAHLTLGRPAAVIRAIPTAVPTADELALPQAIHDLIHIRSGLILVCGKMGTGKSATLTYLVDAFRSIRGGKVVTIEDPVEYVHGGLVAQREVGVGRDVATFHEALRMALRQDADLIVVGEIRDAETLAVALRAADTGPLVIATLHAPTAAQSVTRVMDMVGLGLEHQTRRQLAGCFQAIVAQQLVPTRKGGRRMAAYEILLRNDATATMIREGNEAQLTGAMDPRSGMQTMDRALANLVLGGWIPHDEAVLRTEVHRREELLSMLRKEAQAAA
jgi:twitching motility protein PilT